jgi:hypothetical protein
MAGISLTGPLGLTTTLGGRWCARDGVLVLLWFIAPLAVAPPVPLEVDEGRADNCEN